MTEGISELIKKLDIRAVETQMALRCAPFLAGLKTSNLLIVKNAQAAEVYGLFKNTGYGCFTLHVGGQKTAMLLYAGPRLGAYLKKPEVREILWQQGYRDFCFPALLRAFAARYRAYQQGERGFPHEMGLFLGYPPEDVRGFMEHHGKDSLYSGYWKVYGNVWEKLRLFQKFDRAKEALLGLVANGASMEEVLKCL